MIRIAHAGKPCLGPRLGPRMAVSWWPSDWRGDLHLVEGAHTTGFFGRMGHSQKTDISPLHARITANSRWGACSSWRCRAACQVWSSLGSLGPRSGSEPSSRISRVFPVHDRALRSMKTLIGCRNDGQGTGSPTASTCLAAGRRAVDESSPVLFSKIYPSLGSRRPDGFRECGSPVPNSMTSKRRRDKGGLGTRGGQGRGRTWGTSKITRSSSSGGALGKCAASST